VILGAIERFIGVLIEHYAGAFPTWLSPVQAVVLTVTDRHIPHAQRVVQALTDVDIRVEADLRNEKLGLKVREAQLSKVPYMLIVGDKECDEGGVTPRLRNGQNLPLMGVKAFIDRITEETQQRRE